MSETFVKIDSLQHLEISNKPIIKPVKNSRYNVHCFDVMLIFPNQCGQYIYPLRDYRRRNEEWTPSIFSRLYYLMVKGDYMSKA